MEEMATRMKLAMIKVFVYIQLIIIITGAFSLE